MGILKSIARTALIPSVVIGNAITGVIERDIKKNVNPSYSAGRTTTKEASETTTGKVLGTAIAATGAALAVASGAATKLVSTTKGKVATLVTAGAASVSPTVTNAVIQAPAALVDLGIKVGTEVEKLPDEQTKDLGVGGLLIAGGTGLLTGLITPTIVDVIKDKPNDIPISSTGNAGVIEQAGVITPQTQVLTKTATKKRRKSNRKPSNFNVNQRVNIMLNQSIANKRYLNKFAQ